MSLRTLIFVSLFSALAVSAAAQTCVMARPMSDDTGMAVFQITHILRIEGTWEKAPSVGQILHPLKPVKAFPLIRFGEAVLIQLPEADNLGNWTGIHIHNGCIPAMSGMQATAVINEIVRKPVEIAKTLGDEIESGAPAVQTRPATPKWKHTVCPVCHQVHIRI